MGELRADWLAMLGVGLWWINRQIYISYSLVKFF